jgi:hypothetical protein
MKARLEFEMPFSCSTCFFLIGNYCHALSLYGKDLKISFPSRGLKPDWCPLEPVLTVGDYVKGEK